MYLYLVLADRSLFEVRAAIDLIKEVHCAVCCNFVSGKGLVYATNKPIPADEQNVLGLVVWE